MIIIVTVQVFVKETSQFSNVTNYEICKQIIRNEDLSNVFVTYIKRASDGFRNRVFFARLAVDKTPLADPVWVVSRNVNEGVIRDHETPVGKVQIIPNLLGRKLYVL